VKSAQRLSSLCFTLKSFGEVQVEPFSASARSARRVWTQGCLYASFLRGPNATSTTCGAGGGKEKGKKKKKKKRKQNTTTKDLPKMLDEK